MQIIKLRGESKTGTIREKVVCAVSLVKRKHAIYEEGQWGWNTKSEEVP